MRPRDKILRALTRWLHLHPQFEILKTVVISYTVPVVDVLAGEQIAAEVLLHDEDVLKNTGIRLRRPRVTMRFDLAITLAGHPRTRFCLPPSIQTLATDSGGGRLQGTALWARDASGKLVRPVVFPSRLYMLGARPTLDIPIQLRVRGSPCSESQSASLAGAVLRAITTIARTREGSSTLIAGTHYDRRHRRHLHVVGQAPDR